NAGKGIYVWRFGRIGGGIDPSCHENNTGENVPGRKKNPLKQGGAPASVQPADEPGGATYIPTTSPEGLMPLRLVGSTPGSPIKDPGTSTVTYRPPLSRNPCATFELSR